MTFHQHSRPILADLLACFSHILRPRSHFFLWECTEWALLTYIRASRRGAQKQARDFKASRRLSLGLASALNYGRCIIQDTTHTFSSSSSRAKVRLNKDVIYERPDGRNPVYGVFLCVHARTTLITSAIWIANWRCKCLFISLHRVAHFIRERSAAADSLAASRIRDVIGELWAGERVRSFPWDRPSPFSRCRKLPFGPLSRTLPLPQHCKWALASAPSLSVYRQILYKRGVRAAFGSSAALLTRRWIQLKTQRHIERARVRGRGHRDAKVLFQRWDLSLSPSGHIDLTLSAKWNN